MYRRGYARVKEANSQILRRNSTTIFGWEIKNLLDDLAYSNVLDAPIK